MESAAYVEPTLAIYRALLEGSERSACASAYLHRTPQDVADLLAAGGSIRFVKGAYHEPRDVAIHDARRIREAFQKLALGFLRWGGGGRLALGTHDVELLAEIERAAATAGSGRDDYEIQMLYGIRVADQRRLAREGFRVRVLISYGTHWYPWFMRRVAEHPGRNIWLAIRTCSRAGDEHRGDLRRAALPRLTRWRGACTERSQRRSRRSRTAVAPDPDSFGPLVEFLAEGGVDGLLACGTTGEGVLLTVRERRHVAEAFLAVRPEGFQVAVHAGAQTTRDTVALAAHALEVGADAAAVIAPPTSRSTRSRSTTTSGRRRLRSAPVLHLRVR